MDDGTISWAELAQEVTDLLSRAGIEGAERNGRFIVMKACGAEPEDWISMSGELATQRGVAAIESMARRRAAGEPLQYVLAEWSFRYLDLYLDRRVLIPRPETEVVAGAALVEMLRLAPAGAPITVADLGTGSGAIGLSLASEHWGAQVWLTDASRAALDVARANIAGVGSPGSRIRVAEGSWFDALPTELAGRFGVIVSNPPYVADHESLPEEVAAWEPAFALFAGPDGTEHLIHLVDGANQWLQPEGSLVLEMAPAQVDAVATRAGRSFAQVEVERDLAGRDRVVIARHPET